MSCKAEMKTPLKHLFYAFVLYLLQILLLIIKSLFFILLLRGDKA